MKKFLIAALVVILGIVGIKAWLAWQLVDAPAPAGESLGEEPHPRPALSQLAVRVIVPLEPLRKRLNDEVPKELSGKIDDPAGNALDNDSADWKATRGEIQLRNTGKGLEFEVPFNFKGEARGDLDVLVRIHKKASLNGNGKLKGNASPELKADWSIDPKANGKVDLGKAELKLGPITISLRSVLEKEIKKVLDKEAAKLGGIIDKELRLREKVDEVWREGFLSEPINDEPPVWVATEPRSVAIRPLDYSDSASVSTVIGLELASSVSLSPPATPAPTPLPNLTVAGDLPETSVIRVPLIVSLDRLNDALADESLAIAIAPDTSIRISEIEAELGEKGRIALRCLIEAKNGSEGNRSVKGYFWLSGAPKVDFEKQRIAFSDLEFTTESENLLVGPTAWLLEDLILRKIQESLDIDFADYHEQAVAEIEKAVASLSLPPELSLDLAVESLRLFEAYTVSHIDAATPGSEAGLVLVAEIKGSAVADIR